MIPNMNKKYRFSETVFSLPDEFPVRAYGKGELSQLYFPRASTADNARRSFVRMITRCHDCYRMLCAMGYEKSTRTFTPLMVACIIHHCGSPE